MLKSLRARLILSHILPSLIITPLLGVAIVYVIENQVILPRILSDITGDAMVFAEFMRTRPQAWSDPALAEQVLEDNYYDDQKRLMLLDPEGRMLASSEPGDADRLLQVIDNPLVALALEGHTANTMQYSQSMQSDIVDVMAPVMQDNQVVGIVRFSYRFDTLFEQILKLRYLITGILLLSLLLGVGLGIILAINVANPIRKITLAIFDLASGKQRDRLSEEGPEEISVLLRAVNYLVEQLESLEEARRRLLANLVHEIGRPLGALRTSIQVAQRGGKSDPAFMDELLDGMDYETARLQRLLEDLSNLHDQIFDTLVLKRETVDLKAWLPQTLSTWHQEALKKGLEWSLYIPEDLPTIDADPVRLAQIIGNLASNAIKYTSKGGKLTISAGVKQAQVWIRMMDTGIGITQDDQEKIFSPLYRGDQSKRIVQGMGLGLTIAHDLVEQHGGSITVESQKGVGSIFTVWLPQPKGEAKLPEGQ